MALRCANGCKIATAAAKKKGAPANADTPYSFGPYRKSDQEL